MSRRPVIVLVLVALVVGLVLVDRETSDDAAVVVAAPPPTPVVAGPEARGSTWYCPAGTATGAAEGLAEQVVVMENSSTSAITATVTVLPDEGSAVSRDLEIPASTRSELRVSDLVQSPNAAAVVEALGGELAVSHVLSGPTGSAAGPCASTVGQEWYLPTGTTALGVSQRLAIANPFPNEAVVYLTFETETDTRTPPEFQGLVVPARSVRVVDVSATVTVREQVATRVESRSGLVAVEQVLVAGDESELPTSLVTTLAAPGPAEAWLFPDGRVLDEGVDVRFAVYNPGEVSAEVDVELSIDDPGTNGIVEPYELSVGPRQFQLLDLRQDERVPAGVGWSASVRSVDGTPVVAAMWVLAADPAEPVGQSIVLGTPVVASRWEVPLAGLGEVEAAITIVNPGATAARVRLSRVGGGVVEQLGSGDGVEVPAGGRVTLAAGAIVDPGAASLRIESEGRVAVAWSLTFAEGGGFSLAAAMPVAGTDELVPGVPAVDDSVVLDGATTVPPADPGVTDGTDTPGATEAPDGTEAPTTTAGEG